MHGPIQSHAPRPGEGDVARRARHAAVWALLLTLAASGASAEAEDPWYAGRLRVATGFDYRSGDYGSGFGKTDLLSVPVSLEYRFERLSFSPGDRLRVRVAVPYLRVDGPFRGDASETGGTGVDHGIGDVVLRLSYFYFPASPRWPFVEVAGNVKFPTADEDKDLGTGEFDYLLSLRLAQQFRIRSLVLTPFASAGYKFVGDPPGERRNDTWRAGAGFSLRLDDRWTLGARYTFRESSVPGRGPQHLIGPFANVRLNDRFSLLPYAAAGLSTRAPDWAVGLVLRWDSFIR